MLKIINKLEPFFKDNYKRINVREYARIQKISPPHASTILKNMKDEGLLLKEEDRIYHFFYTNKTNKTLIDLSRLYWRSKIEKSGLIDLLEKDLLNPVIILFGSLSKAEAHPDSDIDLAVFSASEKKIDIQPFEKKLKKKIQLFTFHTRGDVKNKELLNNILNGYKIRGDW
tara:strand:+ start:8 stop:520 length:513 start_codon:yes stop_codon:yes gene_type:complete